MPRYATPQDQRFQGAETAMRVLGASTVSAAIIRLLSLCNDGVTTGFIGKELGIQYHTVFRHIERLHEAGIVNCDTPHEQHHGRRVLYRLAPDCLNEHLQSLSSYLLGENPK